MADERDVAAELLATVVPMCGRGQERWSCDEPAAWAMQLVHESGTVCDVVLACEQHLVRFHRGLDRRARQLGCSTSQLHWHCRPHDEHVAFVWLRV